MEAQEFVQNYAPQKEHHKTKRKRGEITSVSDPTISIIDVRIYAMNKGGKCKDVEYTNPDAPMHWECAEGHSWTASLRIIIENDSARSQGPWCPICNGDRKNQQAQVQQTQVKPVKKASPAKHQKHTNPYKAEDMLAEMQRLATSHGGKCLSAEYVNMKTKLLWECKKGHQFWKRPRSVKHKNRWCNKCRGCFDRYPDNIPPKRRKKIEKSVKIHTQNHHNTSLRSKNVPHTNPSAHDISQIYDLYAFDLNNCTVQYQRKFPQIRNGSPVDDLMRYIRQTSGKTRKVWWFTSENFTSTLSSLKGADKRTHHLFVEQHLKDPGKGLYMDVDTAMCTKISEILVTDHSRISRFFLGSGDKDFYYLIQLAHKYHIPVTVIAVSADSLSQELRNYADHVYIML
ncbi:MAG: NYN domain-containing protein [Candidatus Lokiarchaeota archaeon]|nr:NYN domain-containing protein [Candidatus Lokiarchaeota archaeon]